MKCPECGSRGLVYGTVDQGVQVMRYRHCRMCGHRWRTWEEKDSKPLRAYRAAQGTDLFSEKDESST
jgi:transcriptional regulator NrdR family protein